MIIAAAACTSDSQDAVEPPSTSATTPSTSPTSPTTTAPSPTTAPVDTSTTPATAATEATLAGILQIHLDQGEFVGARISVMTGDGTITEATAGNTSTGPDSAPVGLDAAWGIGSITKSFIGVVTLQLAEEGVIDLDASIIDYLPDLPGADQITPRQLLQHTSGLGEYLDDPLVLDDAEREWSPSELIAVAEAGGRSGTPGDAYRYSNTNYIVLGEIIEQVTGAPWSDAVRTRIIEPLELTNTNVIELGGATGYTTVDGVFVDATQRLHPSIGGAAGGLESTNRDLLHFAAALADGTLLSPESFTAMQAFLPGEDYSSFGIVHSYGLGLERYDNDQITVFGHMGSGAAHSAFVGVDIATGTVVAVTMNVNTPGPQALMAIETLIGLGEAS